MLYSLNPSAKRIKVQNGDDCHRIVYILYTLLKRAKTGPSK